MEKISILGPEILELAQTLWPNTRVTRLRREIAFLAYWLKSRQGELFTYKDLTVLLKEDFYYSSGADVRKSLVAETKKNIHVLVTLTSQLEDKYAFFLVPVPEEAWTEKWTDKTPSQEDADRAMRAFKKRLGVYVTKHKNGVVAVAYANTNVRNANGRIAVNNNRVAGWTSAGLLLPSTQKQFLNCGTVQKLLKG